MATYMMKFITKSNCSTCRAAKKHLEELGKKIDVYDLNKAPLSTQELEALMQGRDHLPFLNTRNVVYREQGYKDKKPTRAQAIAQIAKHPNLLKRPVLIQGKKIILGFQPEEYNAL